MKTFIEEHPYFQAGIFAYLKSVYLFSGDDFQEELGKLSIFVNDRKALFYYILSDEYDSFFHQTGKKEISVDKTGLLLDAFFKSKGDNNGVDADLEYSISHSSLASTDYFTYMQISSIPESKDASVRQEPPNLKHQNIIDTFITRSEMEGGIRIQISGKDEPLPNDTEKANEKDDELNEDIFFTETLAKIYIKQKKYEKAYKIIKHLSLNYPKKNIYFADQLIFLEKLIINSKFKDTK
ncbi:MAG: hypothetical protein LBR26_04020 [Prevotella sp.]|nr:hypothetical protein [Prevotella sp.]